jgi:hypothetical protein
MPKYTVPDREILEAALAGLQHSLTELDDKIADLRRRLGVRGSRNHFAPASRSTGGAPRKHALSPAARRRIAAAQKKRWAAYRKSHKK